MRFILLPCIVTLSFCAGMAFQGATNKPAAPKRARVTGVGGIFFKADNPAKLSEWYQKYLGIPLREGAGPGEPVMFEWREKQSPDTVGITVWAPFPKDTKYFNPSQAPFMINYRVDNLDRMLAQLRAAGVQVDNKVSDDFTGRFGWAIDPEGNRFELWEPK